MPRPRCLWWTGIELPIGSEVNFLMLDLPTWFRQANSRPAMTQGWTQMLQQPLPDLGRALWWLRARLSAKRHKLTSRVHVPKEAQQPQIIPFPQTLRRKQLHVWPYSLFLSPAVCQGLKEPIPYSEPILFSHPGGISTSLGGRGKSTEDLTKGENEGPTCPPYHALWVHSHI